MARWTTVTLAEELHANQKRKASIVPEVPYLSHLMTVAGMVQEYGGSDVAVAAAWLHDSIEDTKPEANVRQRILTELRSHDMADKLM